MIKLSVVIITLDEAANIGRCIRSVAGVADEVLVVDSGSTDDTAQIARALGARVVHRPFSGHVQQKNAAKDLAAFDHVLSLDADEALSPALRAAVAAAKADWQADGYEMSRLNHYLGQPIRHGGWYPDRKLRLWDRRAGRWAGTNPHDRFVLDAGRRAARLEGDLLHYTIQSTERHRQQAEAFGAIGARAHQGRPLAWLLLKAALSPPARLWKMLVWRAGFLDGRAGWRIAWMTSREVWLKYSGAIRLKAVTSRQRNKQ